ncbi:MAG TPA: spore germination protein, partial [Brevibacillus sp.]|nr:spore germination protein [Brevibacillus sp.]
MSQFWNAWNKRKESLRKQTLEQHANKSMDSVDDSTVSSVLEDNIVLVEKQFGKSDDLVVRRFRIATGEEAAVIFLDGMVDRDVISDFVIRAMTTEHSTYLSPVSNELETTNQLRQIVRNILSGNSVLFIDGSSKVYLINSRGWERRSVSEPQTESVVRGPRDGFTETISVNAALIRFRLKDPNLRVKHLIVGQRTQSDVFVMYIEGVVHPPIVEEVIRRIEDLNLDAILESGYIEQMIQD